MARGTPLTREYSRKKKKVCRSPPCPISSTTDASGQVIVAIVPPRVVKEVRSGAETVAVDHAPWRLKDTEVFTLSLKILDAEKRPIAR